MLEKFHHTLPDGHQITLPRFENVPVGLIRRTRKLVGVDQAFTILEELLTEDDLTHLDLLDRNQFNELVTAWRDGSEIELGESTASSSS
ncbi:hypothetical protein [Microbacterium sp. No. 7]|uniref:hypothetical protein n=1 Tax=Microbacterium sp. No. 7 TaxID=1714373 RepID=UPI0006D1792F|nr:hypothetical protein [Microbacterium sp. No. 7]